MNNDLSSLKYRLEKAFTPLKDFLLAERDRNEKITAPGYVFEGKATRQLAGAANDLYYFHPAANRAPKFERLVEAVLDQDPALGRHPGFVGMIETIRTGFKAVVDATIEEKARLAGKREDRALRAQQREELGVDLKKIEHATAETYKTLRSALEPVRISVEARYVEILRQTLAHFESVIDEAGSFEDAFLVKNQWGSIEQELPADFGLFFEVDGYVVKTRGYRKATLRKDVKARVAARAHEAAESEVSSFAGKLAGKIDRDANGKKLSSANVPASGDLWNRSTLIAYLEDGSKQVWTTQIIWNRSYKGTEFNQWPTRRAS